MPAPLAAAAFALVAVLSDRPVEEHGSIRLISCTAHPGAALRILSWPDLPQPSGDTALGALVEGEICRIDYAAPWDPDASARLREALMAAAARHGRTLRGCMTPTACSGAAEARCRAHDGIARAEPAAPGTCLATCRGNIRAPYVETCFELVEVRPS
jgi:hypothetical protein